MILATIILTATGMAFGAFQRLVAFSVTLIVILVATAIFGIATERPLSYTLIYLGLEYLALQVGYILSVVVASLHLARTRKKEAVDPTTPAATAAGAETADHGGYPDRTLKRT